MKRTPFDAGRLAESMGSNIPPPGTALPVAPLPPSEPTGWANKADVVIDRRTYLASRALVGILASGPCSPSTAARAAVRAADALIAVLEGREPKP
jgi:hypothetical protein